VSAIECAVSASIAEEPVTTPPIPFATAITAFATSAIRTVRLSPCIPRPCPYDALAMMIAGNWKMFRGPDPAALAGLDAVVCPPFTRLRECVDAGLTTYAQNVHWEPEGAYTGEISVPLLRELGVVGSLVGHSERRQYFGETDETVARRATAALEAGLRVIACVGETQEERERDETEDVLRRQLAVLEPHPNLVLAYEPVWAIGTGLTATPEMAQEAHAFIKSLLDAPVLYGGSVKPDNAGALLAQPDVDGALVGGASLDVDSFKAICETAARIPS
jgi:triosephosphate isomerase